MTTGERILFQRKKARLTQKALGELCQMPDSQIRQYELGMVEPKMNTIRRIATALHIPISELIDDWNNFSQDEILSDLGDDKSTDITFIDSDIVEYNRIIDKQKNGEGFTPYDRRFISNFIDKSPLVREWFIENGLKSKEKNLEHIQNAYEHLNSEGREEAAKRIEELTEIERYTKPDEWFKGGPTKEEIEKTLKAYLNEDTTDELPEE